MRWPQLPLRLVWHVELTLDRPPSAEPPPAVDESSGAFVETSRHEGPPELGLTPRR
jgi:hypothetical protein